MTKGNGNGNGHDQNIIGIKTSIERPGYLVIRPLVKQRRAKNIPVILANALYKWVMEHPHYRIRAAQGTVENGQTVLLQVWYDEMQGAD